MNWLYIAVMGYIVLSALRGFHRGFLRVVYSLAALLITIAFVAAAVPVTRNLILEHTSVAEQIEIKSEKYIREQIDKKLENGTLTESMGLSWLEIPESILGEMGNGTKKAISDAFEAQGIYKKIAQAAADFCISAIVFFAALVFIRVILFLIGKKLDLFAKVPGINIANMILGFCAGVVKAFIVIWAAFALIKASAILPVSASLIEMIEENAVLKGLYEQNYILELMENWPLGHWIQ